MTTHYDDLGVAPYTPVPEIRKAYLALARTNHPDNFVESAVDREEAEVRMARINAAWAVLNDDTQRSRYIREMQKQGRLPPEPVASATAAGASAVDDAPKRVYRRPPPPKPSKLRLLPGGLLVAAIVLFVLGLLQDSTLVLVVAIVAAVASAILFAVLPRLLATKSSTPVVGSEASSAP